MILLTSQKDAATLALHLNVMRSDYRNLLKKKYKSQKDDYLKAYDYVKKECEAQIEQDLEYKEQHLNIVDLNVLYSFLVAYIEKLQKALKDSTKATGVDLSENDEQVIILKDIKQRCNELLVNVS